MKISSREKWLLALAGLALALTLGYYLGLKPLLEGSADQGAGDLHSQVAAAARLIAKAPRTRARHAALVENLARTEGQYLSDTSVDLGNIALLSLVEALAAETGLTLRAKGIKTIKDSGTPPKVAVEITGEGEPSAITDFLFAVRTARYRLDTERLDMLAREGRILEIRMVISTLLPRAKGGTADE